MQRIVMALLFFLCLLAKPALADDRVLVFAASSLTTALNEIADIYTQRTGNQVTFSFAASSALARQLVHGAPADIYISANEKWMDYAVKQGVVEESTLSDWVKTQLVLISEKKQRAPVALNAAEMLKLLDNSRLALADPNHVPAGIYGKEALQSLGLWDSFQNKLALANSVRSTLALVERGEAPLGIVYYSDAIASSSVNMAAILPEDSHAPIIFPKALTKEASPHAMAFLHFLDSPEAKSILIENGFSLYAETKSETL